MVTFLTALIGLFWLIATGMAIYGLLYRKITKNQTRDGQTFADACVHIGGICFLTLGFLLLLVMSR